MTSASRPHSQLTADRHFSYSGASCPTARFTGTSCQAARVLFHFFAFALSLSLSLSLSLAMSFPVPASIAAELDRINATVEESFQAGDMARLVEAAYHKDGKALPPCQSHQPLADAPACTPTRHTRADLRPLPFSAAFFVSGAPVVSSHANLAGMFQAVKDSGVARVQLRVIERYACDPSAQPHAITELGAYTFYSAGGDAVDEGKFLVVWHASADGSASGYRYAYDMFSTSRPQA